MNPPFPITALCSVGNDGSIRVASVSSPQGCVPRVSCFAPPVLSGVPLFEASCQLAELHAGDVVHVTSQNKAEAQSPFL